MRGPVDGRIDSFEPGHAEDNLVISNRSNEEGVFVSGASDGVFEGNFAIRTAEDSAIGNRDLDRGTRGGF